MPTLPLVQNAYVEFQAALQAAPPAHQATIAGLGGVLDAQAAGLQHSVLGVSALNHLSAASRRYCSGADRCSPAALQALQEAAAAVTAASEFGEEGSMTLSLLPVVLWISYFLGVLKLNKQLPKHLNKNLAGSTMRFWMDEVEEMRQRLLPCCEHWADCFIYFIGALRGAPWAGSTGLREQAQRARTPACHVRSRSMRRRRMLRCVNQHAPCHDTPLLQT